VPYRDWTLLIKDILGAMARIQRYTDGMSFETFADDELRVDAVMRNIGVIGEAARNVPADVQARYPNIPWDEMRRIRNVVIHAYFAVDLPVLWQTVQEDIPPLVPLLRSILQQNT
jgi:uncharacterized protein with HEPN domain